MPVELIRLVHVLSSALMFGVGIGAFWFMRAALRSADVAAIAVTIRNAVRPSGSSPHRSQSCSR
jgi:uncharacterized membrane protein